VAAGRGSLEDEENPDVHLAFPRLYLHQMVLNQ
jgi:hypothetical protein